MGTNFSLGVIFQSSFIAWIVIFLIALFYCDSYSTGYETFDWYDEN